MPNKNNQISEKTLLKWVKEGRGSGQGSEYQPWLTVRDLPSLGRVHRIFGHKSQRTHHLLSDLELAVFLLLEWLPEVTDIREQFPLDRTLTKKLAGDAGIRHPAQQGVEQFMSTDFLVNTTNESESKYALQVKYSSALDDERTVEKLELERRYWAEKGIPWYLVTEQQIPKSVLANVEWLYPAGRRDDEAELPLEQIEFYQHHFSQTGNTTIIEVCKKLDMAYDLEPGESLGEVRVLIAKRYFDFDFFTPIRKLKASEIKAADSQHIQEVYRVSNQ